MRHKVPHIVDALSRKQNAVLCTVLRREGSAPRGAGACMLVNTDGGMVGTVGGGALENEVIKQARACLANERSALISYRLAPSHAGDIGMVCGGDVLVHCWLIKYEQIPIFNGLQNAIEASRDAWLERTINTDGSVLSTGIIASLDIETPMLIKGDKLRFTEPVTLCSRAYVFGGGHIAAELVPMLSRLDFTPVVFDDRAEFANTERFPSAQRVIVGDFEHIGDYMHITKRDYIVIMTRGHSYDSALLVQALRTDAAYIGLIGSRSKIAHTKSLLLAEGFDEADFARVHTPIGLPILAETPAEIAVSVAAQMVLCRAERRAELNKRD